MTETNPFVSVIIPVYNDPEGIRDCLTALSEQSYPDDRYEVIVVDNGSTDNTRSVISEFSVALRIEDEIQGSYAARNTGIAHAHGDVFGFVDADCTPEPNWIEAAMSMLTEQDVDLVSGRVRFEFSEDPSPAERFDAKVNMRNDKHESEGFAKTANVFVRRSVVDEIGDFPSHLQSGGDVYWTQLATKRGFTLAYSPDAVVNHPARRLHPLLSKMYRVGKGSIQFWSLKDDVTPVTIFIGLLRFPLKSLQFLLRSETKSDEPRREIPPDRDVDTTVSVYLVGVLAYVMLGLGRFVGISRQFQKKGVAWLKKFRR